MSTIRATVLTAVVPLLIDPRAQAAAALLLALVAALLLGGDAALAGPNTGECRGVIQNRVCH